MNIQTKWLYCISYREGLHIQQNFVEKSMHTGLCYLLGLEHFPVITLGLSAQAQDILVSPRILKQKQVEVIWTRRGGRATCHSPGQMVIYPIVPLKKFQLSIKQYVYLLEDVTRDFLRSLGVDLVKQKKGPAAIYTQKGKIAFFGVQIQKGITFHGLSINISNDLEFFSLIRSCGINFDNFDCVSHYCTEMTPSPSALESWAAIFSKYIGVKNFT